MNFIASPRAIRYNDASAKVNGRGYTRSGSAHAMSSSSRSSSSESPNPAQRIGGRPRDECAVFAVAGHAEAARFVSLGLFALQHRGQETTGIVSAEVASDPAGGAASNPGGKTTFHIHRAAGLVADAYSDRALAELHGDVAIGHNRYSTTGDATASNTQPLTCDSADGPIALAHNGNLTNARELREELEAGGATFATDVDSEVILHLIRGFEGDDSANGSSNESGDGRDKFEARLGRALLRLEGAYSLVVLHGTTLYAVRDPRAMRPLVLGRLDGGAWAVASETVALDLIGARTVRDMRAGEVVRLVPEREPQAICLAESGPPVEPAHCIFELIYFSRPDSVADGQSVLEVRERLGAELWAEHPAPGEVVIGIPDSSIPAAVGYARAAGLRYETGLVRNRYVGRTFIEPNPGIRNLGARLKYSAVRSVVAGKSVIVVDDSLVRGTTSRQVIPLLREAGAREIHLRITAPPWRHPCRFGIDAPDPADFIASDLTVEEIRRSLALDSLGFLSVAALHRAAGRATGWCMACFTGEDGPKRNAETPDSESAEGPAINAPMDSTPGSSEVLIEAGRNA